MSGKILEGSLHRIRRDIVGGVSLGLGLLDAPCGFCAFTRGLLRFSR